jgi:hypothetical protein
MTWLAKPPRSSSDSPSSRFFAPDQADDQIPPRRERGKAHQCTKEEPDLFGVDVSFQPALDRLWDH